MSSLLQLEKGNQPLWCLTMVSSKLRALSWPFVWASNLFSGYLLYKWLWIFRNVISLDEYASYFDNIDPLAPYKKWMTGQDSHKETRSKANVVSDRVHAAFVVSDPVDWSRDIQVIFIPLCYLQFFFFCAFSQRVLILMLWLRSSVTFYELEGYLGNKLDLNLICTLQTTI